MKTPVRVYLSFNPETRGTLSKFGADGRFRVTWDTPDPSRSNPRMRIWYARDVLGTAIRPGVPE